MTENIENLLKNQIEAMVNIMTSMLLERLKVPETSDPKEVTQDFSEKLGHIIGDYVLKSFQDYDGVLQIPLQETSNKFSSLFYIRRDEVFFKKSIYSLRDNHIFQRVDNDSGVDSEIDINEKDSLRLMDNLYPKEVKFLPDSLYPDRPLTENRMMSSDFETAGIYTVTDEEKVFGDIKNFIPIIIAASKGLNAIIKEYDKLLGVVRDNDYGDITEAEPSDGTLLYRIKQLESKIGDENTEGTILFQLKNLNDRVSALENASSTKGGE